MVHEMKLNKIPYNYIKNEEKDIELRLNDEKRQNIFIGGHIVFTNIETNESLKVIVTNLYKFRNFKQLYERFDKIRLGYEVDELALPSDMNEYYSEKEIEINGVMGIEIKLSV